MSGEDKGTPILLSNLKRLLDAGYTVVLGKDSDGEYVGDLQPDYYAPRYDECQDASLQDVVKSRYVGVVLNNLVTVAMRPKKEKDDD